MIESFANELRLIPWVKRPVLAYRERRTALVERYLCIDTGGAHGLPYSPGTRLGDGNNYVPVDYGAMWRYMRPVHLSPCDVLFDIGCGMGRVLCLFARRPIARCIGVELDSALAVIAQRNAASLRGRRSPIEVRIGDAVDVDYTEGTIFWMFNPFGKKTLERVMEHIERSLRASPRRIQLVYIRPEHEDVLRASRWLRCTGRQTAPFHDSSSASYWTGT